MRDLRGKVAYLQGLLSGLRIDENSAEGKLFMQIADVLEDISDEVDDLRLEYQDLEEYVESMDEDLAGLEEDYYQEMDGEMVEMTCPECGETVYVDRELLDMDSELELTCPNCGELIYDNPPDLNVPEYDESLENQNH